MWFDVIETVQFLVKSRVVYWNFELDSRTVCGTASQK